MNIKNFYYNTFIITHNYGVFSTGNNEQGQLGLNDENIIYKFLPVKF
jgi:hypothetical protein